MISKTICFIVLLLSIQLSTQNKLTESLLDLTAKPGDNFKILINNAEVATNLLTTPDIEYLNKSTGTVNGDKITILNYKAKESATGIGNVTVKFNDGDNITELTYFVHFTQNLKCLFNFPT